MSKWTPEQDQIIRDAYEVGTRIKDIAEANGWTRNQVIGRARVLGLSKWGRQLDSPYCAINTHYPMSAEAKGSVIEALHAGRDLWRKNNPEKLAEIMAKARAARHAK